MFCQECIIEYSISVNDVCTIAHKNILSYYSLIGEVHPNKFLEIVCKGSRMLKRSVFMNDLNVYEWTILSVVL